MKDQLGFFYVKKKSANDKFIKSLRNEKGVSITSNNGIQEECVNFYESLYSDKDIDPTLDDYFPTDIPSLNEESSNICEGEITLAHSSKVISPSHIYLLHESPGPDELPK